MYINVYFGTKLRIEFVHTMKQYHTKEDLPKKGKIEDDLRTYKIFIIINHSISYLCVNHNAQAIPAPKLLNHSRMLPHHIDDEL